MASGQIPTFGRAAAAARTPSAESAEPAETGLGTVVLRRSGWRVALAWAFFGWPLGVAAAVQVAAWLATDPADVAGHQKGVVVMLVLGGLNLFGWMFFFRRSLFTRRPPLVLTPEGLQLSVLGSQTIHPWRKVHVLSMGGGLSLIACRIMVEQAVEDDLRRSGWLPYAAYRLVRLLLPRLAKRSAFVILPLIYTPGAAEVECLIKAYKASASAGES